MAPSAKNAEVDLLKLFFWHLLKYGLPSAHSEARLKGIQKR